jgi:hypothetical protein
MGKNFSIHDKSFDPYLTLTLKKEYTIMDMILKRLKEPSSWASLAAMLALVGINLPESMMQNVTQVGMGLAGILGFFMSDPGHK